jgi:hypothetical protein
MEDLVARSKPTRKESNYLVACGREDIFSNKICIDYGD